MGILLGLAVFIYDLAGAIRQGNTSFLWERPTKPPPPTFHPPPLPTFSSHVCCHKHAYACMFTHTQTLTHTHTHTLAHTHVHTYIVHSYACVHVYSHTQTCMHARTHADTHSAFKWKMIMIKKNEKYVFCQDYFCVILWSHAAHCAAVIKDSCGGRNSSVGSAWACCPQRRGFDPPLGTFSVEGIFPLELTWVQTPFPQKLLRMRV